MPEETSLPRRAGRASRCMQSGTFPVLRAAVVSPDTHEGELVAAMMRSDPAAWREFQRRYALLVRSCIRSVTRRVGAATCEDDREIEAIFLCSLFVRDMKRLRAFDPELGRLSTWIGRLAANCAHDYVRALHRKAPQQAAAELEDVVCERRDPFEHAVDRERAQLAARTLESFSELDRRFASLYFGEGLPPSDVARLLNISLSTVYSKKNKLRSRLEAICALGDAAA
jgi:RNA polymerase sigma-70 factor (ECF subfamily)